MLNKRQVPTSRTSWVTLWFCSMEKERKEKNLWKKSFGEKDRDLGRWMREHVKRERLLWGGIFFQSEGWREARTVNFQKTDRHGIQTRND